MPKQGYVLSMESDQWEARTFDGYKDIRDAIGGYIEAIPVRCRATVYGHDEGKLIKLTPTAVWIDPESGQILDILCGPLVVLGAVDKEGDDTSITPGQFEEVQQHIVPIVQEEREFVIIPEPVMRFYSFDDKGNILDK